MWEEAANEAIFAENTAYVKCPGCKMVFEKVIGVLPPGMALTGVPELDRTAPFIELDNEGQRLSRSAMCHKSTNRFRCRMCTTDFCGACMEFPYHLGRSCEEIAEEKIAAKCLFCEALLRGTRRWSDDKDLNLRYVHFILSCRSICRDAHALSNVHSIPFWVASAIQGAEHILSVVLIPVK